MPTPEPQQQEKKFLIQIGRALHKFGTPSYRLENLLCNTAELIGIKAEFLVATTSLTFSFTDDKGRENTNIIRVKPGEINLAGLAETDSIIHQLGDGHINLTQAQEKLDAIIHAKPIYSKHTELIAFSISSASFALLLLSNVNDMICSGLIGIVVYGLISASQKSYRIAHMLEPLAAFVAAFTASVIATFININVPLVTLSAIIIFIPGLSLTIGLSELAERHLQAGTTRVMDSCMSLFKLFFGAHIGMVIASRLWTPLSTLPEPGFGHNTIWLALVCLSCSLNILFNMRPRDLIWNLVAANIAYGFTQIGIHTIGADLAPFVGALTVGIFANIYSRFMNSPASIVLLPGIVVLVPGSKTYMSLSSGIAGQSITLNAANTQQVFLIFMAIVAGLIFANAAMPPKRSL